ncbi:PREDICTED: uncharacterized protein LOC109217579 [Nicotiana attenuata]|uniref:uncharacterized protein LOC109217579 n=1 Tax=Nicotiana attenuata TaxID=49451 RepID=UPI00090463BA|nr:PREDICTED: uncharacterized protein LOC109217579 [Nicotiana attenuata]
MTDCKPSPSPTDNTVQLSKHGETFADPSVYRIIVGALQYVAITRPEISFSVSRVRQYMYNPTMDHWKAVQRILHYLKGTLTYGLSIAPSTSSSMHVYCDVGWAADPDDRYHVSWLTSLLKELQLPCRRALVDRGQLSVRYIPSTDQTDDVFTKALSSSRFSQLRSKINVSKLDMSLLGGVR